MGGGGRERVVPDPCETIKAENVECIILSNLCLPK